MKLFIFNFFLYIIKLFKKIKNQNSENVTFELNNKNTNANKMMNNYDYSIKNGSIMNASNT